MTVSPSPLKNWILACRPKTLPAGIAPVLLGTGMAFGDGIQNWPAACVALFGAVMLQIGTNLANDYFDFKKGADTDERVGPVRVTQAGLISPSSMQSAIILSFSLAALACAWLVIRAGWPIAIIGVAAILSGILYTAGPKPLGYMGMGEIFVLIFFGPVAVGGTYYVQGFEMNAAVLLAGLAMGCLSSAILVVNNLRDITTDEKSGKRTLAVRFGATFSRYEYYFLIMAAAVLPVAIYAMTRDHIATLLCTLTALFALPGVYNVFTKTDGPSLNATLAFTGQLTLFYALIFAVGWIL